MDAILIWVWHRVHQNPISCFLTERRMYVDNMYVWLKLGDVAEIPNKVDINNYEWANRQPPFSRDMKTCEKMKAEVDIPYVCMCIDKRLE